MIIKKKLFTRQETKAMKEIYNALKNGTVGRGLSANNFVRARHVSNETIDALTGNGVVENYAKNAKVIKDIGLPETGKAYKRMMEKYTNPELHRRFARIQENKQLGERLRKLRKANKEVLGAEMLDPMTVEGKIAKRYYPDNLKELQKSILEDKRSILKELDELKRKRSGSSYKVGFKKVSPNGEFEKEFQNELRPRYIQAKKQHDKDPYSNPEVAQRAINHFKKEGIKISTDNSAGNSYIQFLQDGKFKHGIVFQSKRSKRNPATALHEWGHYRGNKLKQVRPEYYQKYEPLGKADSAYYNLEKSIKNRVSDLATLTDEANSSYIAAAREGGYGSTKEQVKAGKQGLSNAFRTYELGSAAKILRDKYSRKLAKERLK